MYTLSDLDCDKHISYDAPVLVNVATPGRLISMQQFQNYFAAHDSETGKPNPKYLNFLEGIDLENVLVAGGCMASLIHGNTRFEDVDMFIYGLDESEADARVTRLLEQIIAADQYSDDLQIRKNNYCITVTGSHTYQIIFRLYKSIQEILDGFDLGSSCVGYDGKQVWLNERGKFSHENNCNVVDVTKRSTTFEARLRKYFNRGYSIVLPGLNVHALPTARFEYGMSELCELPYMPFSYRSIHGNMIDFEKFRNRSGHVSNQTHDYEDDTGMGICYMNLYNLLHDKHFYVAISNSSDIVTKAPNINIGAVRYIYKGIRNHLLSDAPNLRVISKYITTKPAHQIIYEAHEAPDKTKYVDDIIQAQIEIVQEKMRNMGDYSKIQWRVIDPGSQASGSFNPVLTDEAQWYGPYKS